jgi:uroporphyrinogen-III synthase
MSFFRYHTPLAGQKIACLGPGAAQCLAQYDYVADFVGDGVPERVAEDLQKKIGREKVAFLQARRSRASVQHLLANYEQALAVVVYDNQLLSDFTLAPADYLIFTSPLNFKAYQQRYSCGPEQRLIGIGNTTGETFSRANNVNAFRIASSPNEQALLDCLMAWEQESPINHSFFR